MAVAGRQLGEDPLRVEDSGAGGGERFTVTRDELIALVDEVLASRGIS